MVNYSYDKFDEKTMAKASGTNLKISLKKSVEMSREIQGKKISEVILYLGEVMKQKRAVPYLRYFAETAHRKGKGISTGGYPTLVAKEFLKLLNSAKSNAEEKTLEIKNLRVISVSARKGQVRHTMGRYSGRKNKATNVEIIIGEKIKK